MITHVAIWRNNTIYALPKPNRHHHVFQITSDEDQYPNVKWEIQGFLDDNNNFLDRREAYKIATTEGQIARNLNPSNYQGDELFSEDLW